MVLCCIKNLVRRFSKESRLILLKQHTTWILTLIGDISDESSSDFNPWLENSIQLVFTIMCYLDLAGQVETLDDIRSKADIIGLEKKSLCLDITTTQRILDSLIHMLKLTVSEDLVPIPPHFD